MKLISFLTLLGLAIACDPYGFGFKKNPAYVLNEAFEAMLALDAEAYIEVTGKEALCLYGNQNGLAYLRDNLNVNSDNVEIKPKLISNLTRQTPTPRYVGFWSYYHEVYQIDILSKSTKEEFLRVAVECDYGFEGEKKPEYSKITKVKKFKKKECVLVKIIPSKFKPLPMRPECEPLKVTL